MALFAGRYFLRAAKWSPPSLPLSSSSAQIRLCLRNRRFFSSTKTDSTKLPLLLWIGDGYGAEGSRPRHWPRSHPLLVPSVPVVEHIIHVDEKDDDAVSKLVDLVEAHYGESNDDVGGMGESDQGVWLAGVGNHDVLDHVLLIHEAIQTIQQHRHGIPFRLYSSGKPKEDVDWETALVSAKKWALQISLFAPNPPDYARLTGARTKDFSQLCGIIATVAESVPNIKLEIGVMQEYAGPTQALAASLGARQVFSYGPEDHVPTC
jgi:hypothetical protein